MNGRLIHRLWRGEKLPRPPFWFMRQAGRYLPEYRELRSKADGFLNLCYNPEWAAEVTLQPIRRFNMDAAILFSDILVIPLALGMDVRFVHGEGPKLNPLTDKAAVERLTLNAEKYLNPIAETVKKVRAELAPEKSLIGFCGAPWTVACYMIEGGGSKDFQKVRRFAREQKDAFSLLIETLVESSFTYLCMQVEAGADVLQIFDSWAGVLSEEEFEHWVILPTAKLIQKLKSAYPDLPIIGFPRCAGANVLAYTNKTSVDIVGLDVQVPLVWARESIVKALQGNLDPILLACNKQEAIEQTKHIMEQWSDHPFIFNLGHGMLPFTPLENVQAVCDIILGKA